MKSLILLSVAISLTCASTFRQGMLQGMGIEIISPNDCESTEVPLNINDIDFKQSESLLSLEQALQPVLSEVDCLDTQLGNEIRGFVTKFTHPSYVTQDWIIDGINYSNELQNFKFDESYQAGYEMGLILNKVMEQQIKIAQTIASTNEVLVQIYSGFVRGFYEEGGIKIEDIQACFFGASGAVQDFIGGVQLLASKDPKLVKEGLRMLGMGLQILPDAIKECKQAYQEMQDFSEVLSEAIALLENPSSFAFEIGRHLIVNGRDIYKETNIAIKDWNQDNYTDFGYQLGRIIYQLVVGGLYKE